MHLRAVAIAWTTALSYVLLMCPLDIAVTYQVQHTAPTMRLSS